LYPGETKEAGNSSSLGLIKCPEDVEDVVARGNHLFFNYGTIPVSGLKKTK